MIEPELWAIKFYIAGIRIFDFFCSCDLDLDPMTFAYKLDPFFPGDILDVWKETSYIKSFESYYYSLRMHAFSYAWSLLVMWQRWWLHHWINQSWKPIIHANLMALSFMELKLWSYEQSNFRLKEYRFSTFFAPVTLNLTQWPSYTNLTCMKIHQMCKYELPMPRLSKVIFWQTDRHTYIQTDRQDCNSTSRRFADGQKSDSLHNNEKALVIKENHLVRLAVLKNCFLYICNNYAMQETLWLCIM